MRNKLGVICMVLGTVLVLSALSLFLSNRKEDREAGIAAEKVLTQVIEQIETPLPQETEGGEDKQDQPTYPDPYDPAMTEVEIDGYAYVGYLSIPALELELPVMSQWDYARLKIAPCRYTGSAKTGDFVICAHNYDRHFGLIRNLKPGDRIAFTDMDGVVRQYAVETVEILAPTAVEAVTAGDYDLTLFTCTYGGTSRVTVRCEQVDDK